MQVSYHGYGQTPPSTGGAAASVYVPPISMGAPTTPATGYPPAAYGQPYGAGGGAVRYAAPAGAPGTVASTPGVYAMPSGAVSYAPAYGQPTAVYGQPTA